MKRSVLQGVALSALVVSAGACGGWEEGRDADLTSLSRRVVTQTDGYARVNIRLDKLATRYHKFLMASRDADGERTVYVDRIEGPSGDVLRRFTTDLEVSEFRTGAIADQDLNHFNWPIASDDDWLEQGIYTVWVGAVNDNRSLASNASIDVNVLLATDGEPQEGSLIVNVHYAGGVDSDPEYKAAFDDALVVLEEIYEEIGITIVVNEVEAWPDANLPRPGFGAPETWEALSGSTGNTGIDLVVVDTISGSDASILGAAGSIPGGLSASEKSGVILSASANAGPDLAYSSSEIDLLGSTMAHEIGHMLGLFHPVDLGYDRWDALDDTENCESESACQTALGSNLMYPTALCSQSSCLTQDAITINQAGVMHRYTGVQ